MTPLAWVLISAWFVCLAVYASTWPAVRNLTRNIWNAIVHHRLPG